MSTGSLVDICDLAAAERLGIQFRRLDDEQDVPGSPPIFVFGNMPASLTNMLFGCWRSYKLGAYVIPQAKIGLDGLVFVRGQPIECVECNYPGYHSRALLQRSEQYSPRRRLVSGGPIISLIGPGWNVWGHWMLDFLPRLLLAQKLGLVAADTRFCILARSAPFAFELLDLCGISREDLVLLDDEQDLTEFETLVMPTNLTRGSLVHPLYREFARMLVSRAMSKGSRVGGLHQRIFVSRRSSGVSRELCNREEIEDVARRHGYYVVDPNRLPILDQVSLFAGAKLIAGEYGSGLHNCLFSQRGTVVVAMRSQENHPGFLQSGLCGALDQAVGYVFGDSADSADPHRITVKPEEFARALDCAEVWSRQLSGRYE